MKLLSVILVCTAALIAYTAIVGPLRRVFDDEWPYINSLLKPPGQAAETLCIVSALIVCIIHWKDVPPFYRRMGIGFMLLLIAGLVNNLYGAWAVDNQTNLDKLIFQIPWRRRAWEWYFFIGVPHLVATAGYVFMVWALTSLTKRNQPGREEV